MPQWVPWKKKQTKKNIKIVLEFLCVFRFLVIAIILYCLLEQIPVYFHTCIYWIFSGCVVFLDFPLDFLRLSHRIWAIFSCRPIDRLREKQNNCSTRYGLYKCAQRCVYVCIVHACICKYIQRAQLLKKIRTKCSITDFLNINMMLICCIQERNKKRRQQKKREKALSHSLSLS